MNPFARPRTPWPAVALALALASIPRAAAAETPFSITTLDTVAYAGYSVAMVVDAAGEPHIAYTQYPTPIVRYAHRSGGVWTIEDVGDWGKQFPAGIAIALDGAGTPHIAYVRDGGIDQARLAVRTPGGWSHETVDAAHLYLDLKIDASDRLHLVYRQDRWRLRYARRTDGIWSFETADTGYSTSTHAKNFEQVSMALDAGGEPAVAFHSGTGNRHLGFARRVGGTWYPENPDVTTCTGFMADVQFDETGAPTISYLAGYSGHFWLATKSGGTWDTQLVDDQTWPPGVCLPPSTTTSLVFDPSGAARLAWGRFDPWGLVFAAEVDGQWLVQTVDGVSDAGNSCVLGLTPDGRPMIAYGSAAGLRFAEATGPIVGVPPGGDVSAAFSLEPAAPNPVRPGAPLTLRFALPADAAVTVELSDVAGRRVASQPARTFAAGPQSLRLETPGLAPGVYFARVAAQGLGERVARFVVVD